MSASKLGAFEKAPKPKKSFFDSFNDIPPASAAPTFKFIQPGDYVFARFNERRFNVQTKKANQPATILDVDILKSMTDGEDGPTGKAGIFESSGITQVMDSAALNEGEIFYLRFDSLGKQFKRFAFRKLNQEEIAGLKNEVDDIPF